MSRPRRNWHQSNASLINRGKIEMWISQERIGHWQATSRGQPKRGRRRIYSTTAILACHLVRIAYGLPYRQMQGFLMTLLQLAGLPIPHYSLVCRRFKEIESELPHLSKRRPSAIVLDSSGLKLYGPGEWLAFKHREGRRRKWVKLHVALDPATQEVICAEVTDANESDALVGARIVKRLPKSVREVIGDGAYDTRHFRNAVQRRGAKVVVPPRSSARLTEDAQRNDDLRLIRGLGDDSIARGLWKKLVGYGRRSLVETFFSRLKGAMGPGIRSRSEEARRVEVKLKLIIINRFLRNATA
jgi:transposase